MNGGVEAGRLTDFGINTAMTSQISTEGTYYPPSGRAESTHPSTSALATGYELECLLKLEEAYRDARESIQNVMARLNEWGPSWGSHYDELDGSFSDEERILKLMRIDLAEETRMFARAKEQHESWQASLPPSGSEVEGRRSFSYRLEKIAKLAKEEEERAFSMEMLKEEIAKQQQRVEELHKEVVPSLSVVNYTETSYKLLSLVEEMLHQEYIAILGRLHRPIDSITSEIWARVFCFTVDLQEEETLRAISTCDPPESLLSPRQMALSIASVCRSWRMTSLLEPGHAIWQPVLVDAGDLARRATTMSSIPGRNSLHPSPISIRATVFTFSEDNLRHANPPLLRWIRRFSVASLKVVYRTTPLARLDSILRIVANTSSFRTLSLICQDAEFPGRTTLLHASVFARLHSLELVDLDIDVSSLQSDMNEMKSLCVRYTRQPPFHKRPTSIFLYQLLSRFPALVEVEVDLNFEDTPDFGSARSDPPYNALCRLRTLTTRFSYFQNRLSFLQHLPLLALESIVLVNIPTFTAQEVWDPLQSLLNAGGRGRRIKHLDILDTLPQMRGLFNAGYITSKLPNLETLTLRKGAVDHFILYLLQEMIEGDFPLPNLQYVDLWDATLTEDAIMGFVRMYCDTALQRSTGSVEATASGSTPGGTRHGQLQRIELYRCEGISYSALNEIDCLLRGTGPSWARVEAAASVPAS